MSFCGPQNQQATSLTDSDLTAHFGSLTQPGLLPPDGFPLNQRDERGLLNRSFVEQTVTQMINAGTIPKPPKINNGGQAEGEQVENFAKKDAGFINALKSEYCFYDSRYKYALQQLIAKLQIGYTNNDQTNQVLIQNYLKATQGLNQRLNDLSQITNEITRQRLQETQNLNTDINKINSDLSARSAKLAEQNKILSSQQATALLYKDMVKYTKEKANAQNNLLTLYSFLNIVALGLLVYVYRSAAE
jgi:hypothetical protein